MTTKHRSAGSEPLAVRVRRQNARRATEPSPSTDERAEVLARPHGIVFSQVLAVASMPSPTLRLDQCPKVARRTSTRARGAGRPRATASRRTSSSSSDDPGEPAGPPAAADRLAVAA
jgi:hypothetical protein